MSQSPQQAAGSKRYADGWRAINELIRSDGSWSGRERNVCFRNGGGGKFSDVSYVTGLDFDGDGRALAVFDYDNDGDQDLLIKFRTAPQLRLMRNESSQPERALRIALQGAASHRDAVGARVVLETSRRQMVRDVASGSSFLSQHSRRLHFGLEEGERPQRLLVRWPGREEAEFNGIPLTGLLRIVEGTSRAEAIIPPRTASAKFSASRPSTLPTGTWLLSSVPAPVFSLQTLNGRQVSLASLRNRKVLVTFWATWCPPCRKELEDLRDQYALFRGNGVEVLAISVDDPGDAAAVRKFAAELRLPFPVLFADDRTVAVYSILNRHLFDRRRDLGIPTSFLINGSGEIVKVYAGSAPVPAMLADARAMKGEPIPFPGVWMGSPPGRNYLDLATAFAERGLHEDAKLMFAAAGRAGQASGILLANQGSLLLAAGDLSAAEKVLRQALQLNPNQAEAMINLGTLLVRADRPAEAVPFLESALRVHPDDPALLNALGTARFRLADPAAAEDFFRDAIALDSGSADTHFNLGAVLASSGRRPEAIEEFEKARSLGRNTVDLHNNLGVLYMETNSPTKAKASFESALSLDARHSGTRLNLALYFLKTGDTARGRELLEALVRSNPEFQPAQELLRSLR